MAGDVTHEPITNSNDLRIQLDLPWLGVDNEERASQHAGQREAERRHWDAFWADHAANTRAVDRILWAARVLFAALHARLLAGRLRAFAASANPSIRCLEIGCGSATTLGLVSRRVAGSEGFAIDLSLQAIRVARSRNPRLRCVVADALALPFAEGSFALAFSSGVIEHFERQTAQAMVREHCRVVKRGGTVGVTVPWKASPYNLLRILCGRHWPFGHEDPFLARNLRRFLSGLALERVSIRAVLATTLTGMGTRSRLPARSEGAVQEREKKTRDARPTASDGKEGTRAE
jgi:SAM-dependent methyltransferase